MKFSRKTDYGVLLIEALRPTFSSGRWMTLRSIAKAERLPEAFLGKLAEILRRGEYLEAQRGRAGGYRLRKDPKEMTLKEVIDIFEEPPMMRCMRSPDPKKHCPLALVCPSRKKWSAVEKKVNRIFEGVTLASL